MKKINYYVMLLVALGWCLSIQYAIATPSLVKTESSNSLEFGAGTSAKITLENLLLLENYTIMVANNTESRYNISFIATSTIAQIDITYDGTLFDIYNQSLTQLQLIILEAGSVSIIMYLDLHVQTFNNALQWLIDKLLLIFYIFISGIALLLLFKVIDYAT